VLADVIARHYMVDFTPNVAAIGASKGWTDESIFELDRRWWWF